MKRLRFKLQLKPALKDFHDNRMLLTSTLHELIQVHHKDISRLCAMRFTLRLVVAKVSQKSSPFSKGRENGAWMSVDQDSISNF